MLVDFYAYYMQMGLVLSLCASTFMLGEGFTTAGIAFTQPEVWGSGSYWLLWQQLF